MIAQFVEFWTISLEYLSNAASFFYNNALLCVLLISMFVFGISVSSNTVSLFLSVSVTVYVDTSL